MSEQIKDSDFWRSQIQRAKDDNAKYFAAADEAEKAFVSTKSYNIFYSNVQTLKANLLTNTPKPDVERRFIKKSTSNKLQYNTFLEVASITEASLTYITDVDNVIRTLKDIIEKAKKTGRGVAWITYEPTIESKKDELGNVSEEITDRVIKIDSVGYKDYLCSTAKNKKQIWWKAKLHLLSKEELKEKFGYDASDDNLGFTNGGTERKLAEVWEIWDKTERMRHYLLLAQGVGKLLKSSEDPYKLEGFFPCDDLTPLTIVDSIVPLPEYEIYKKKATELDKISALADQLEQAIKYVVLTDKINENNTQIINNALEGDVVTIQSPNPLNGDPSGATSTMPIDEAVKLAVHREEKKQVLKQDIYDITGISDIMRGQSDAQETAKAQQIKGVFGSLRFQDQQKDVQALVVSIFRIVAEIICEHYDAETLMDITSTYLPTAEEKAAIQAKIAQIQTMQSNPMYANMPVPEISEQEIKLLEQPTWDDVIKLMRDEKLRNYTIDIQSTATVFDDLSQQNAGIAALTMAYKDVIATAMQFNNPAVLRGFIPIAKMQLTNIKTGRAIAKHMIEGLESVAQELEQNIKAQKGQLPPQIQLQQQELQLKAQEIQARIASDSARVQTELLKEQNRAKEIYLREQEIILKTKESQSAQQIDAGYKQQSIGIDQQVVDIKKQEADRKDAELMAQIKLKSAELSSGQNINTNIAGDVPTLE